MDTSEPFNASTLLKQKRDILERLETKFPKEVTTLRAIDAALEQFTGIRLVPDLIEGEYALAKNAGEAIEHSIMKHGGRVKRSVVFSDLKLGGFKRGDPHWLRSFNEGVRYWTETDKTLRKIPDPADPSNPWLEINPNYVKRKKKPKST